jgi:hypothetical protein
MAPNSSKIKRGGWRKGKEREEINHLKRRAKMALSEILKTAGAPQDQIDEALKMEGSITDFGEKVTALNSEAASHRKKASGLGDQLKQFEGMDPVKYAEIMEKHHKDSGDFETLKTDLTNKFAVSEKASSEKYGTLESKYKNLVINQGILGFASELNAINPAEVVDLLRANVKLSEDGSPMVMDGETERTDGKGGKLPLKAYVEGFLAERPHHVKPGKRGSGSQGNNGGENNGGKTISRDAYDALSALEKRDFSKEGGQVTD